MTVRRVRGAEAAAGNGASGLSNGFGSRWRLARALLVRAAAANPRTTAPATAMPTTAPSERDPAAPSSAPDTLSPPGAGESGTTATTGFIKEDGGGHDDWAMPWLAHTERKTGPKRASIRAESAKAAVRTSKRAKETSEVPDEASWDREASTIRTRVSFPDD
jgi:hypothetical protein